MTVAGGRGRRSRACRSGAVVGLALGTAALAGCVGAAPDTLAEAEVQALLDVAWSGPVSGADRMEALVAQCMADAGFTYVPPTAPTAPSSSSETGAQTPDAAGYGITRGPAPLPPAADPNAAALAALDPADQAAYRVALMGSEPDASHAADPADAPGAAEWEYDWRGAGCRGWAQNQVYGDPATLDDSAALQAELDEARLAAASDARVVALDASWAACMATSAYPGMTSPDAARASVVAAWDALWATAWAGLPAQPSPSDVEAAQAGARDTVATLAAHEVALASADRACRDQVAYDATRAAVDQEYRDRFYQAHRTALEAWLAPVGDDPAGGFADGAGR